MSNGASFTDDGTGSAIAHALPSAATATSTETTGAIAYDPNATDAVNASAAQTALTALAGLSGNVTVAFASKTYTITFAGSLGTVAALTVDGSKLTGTQHSLYLKIGDGDGDTHLDLTASVAGTNLNFHAMIGPFGLYVAGRQREPRRHDPPAPRRPGHDRSSGPLQHHRLRRRHVHERPLVDR